MTHTEIIEETEYLDLHFAQIDEGEALAWVMRRSRSAEFSYVVTPNVDHIVQLHRDAGESANHLLDRAYHEADLRLCDSRIVTMMGRWNNLALSLVTGSGLVARMVSKPLPTGLRIALVGGNDRQRAWLASKQPDCEIIHYQPPMGLRTNMEAQAVVAAFVEETAADITLLTVGAPQSELIANLIRKRGRARGVALCVGASLEFLTGEKRRAPEWVQSLSMEWAFRLLSEPRRLARRYLIDGPRIFLIWYRWTTGAQKAPHLATRVMDAPPGTPGLWSISRAPGKDVRVGDLRFDPVVEPFQRYSEPVPTDKRGSIANSDLVAGGGLG